MNPERLSLALEHGQRALRNIPKDLPPTSRAEMVTDATMRLIRKACAEAVPKLGSRRKRRPAYWWTKEIADLRGRCLYLRRSVQRVRRRDLDTAPIADEFKAAKKDLKRAIKCSQQRCWKELGQDLNNDPWGLGYKIVTRKLRAFASECPKDAVTMNNIVNTLFPTHPERPDRLAASGHLEVPPFTEGELSRAARSMRNKRAPGPDRLPAELLKAITISHPKILLDMYNACLKAGFFPTRWKIARLVLISKGKGPADAPASYRPLCMLDTAGKLLEKMLQPRLHEAVRAAGDLAPKQYGFRRGRSTINAVQEVIAAARSTERGNYFSRPVCLLATLDVKNAFNSVRWDKAMDALERDFRVPEYLLQMLGDYLKDRYIVYNTDDGPKELKLSAGAAQGSILGSDIWNVTYDDILRMEMPEGTCLIGYADDLAVTIIARDVEIAQARLNQVMCRVCSWLEDHGLELAKHKTEIVLLTKRRINTSCLMQVGDATVQTTRAVKYLGVTLDSKLTFGEHLRRAATKAVTVTSALSRIMANTTGPWSSKRRLLMSIAESIMLYGAEVWADALRHEVYRKRLAMVQRRGALRIACSYRTVSEPAVLAIAGVIPIDLLAQERHFVHQQKSALGKTAAQRIARTNTIQAWQSRWEEDGRGRWTARLIKRLDTWFYREEGEINYYLTQFLSGHGLFGAYLHKMGKVTEAGCVYCDCLSDDANHTFFHCERWCVERGALESDLGAIITQDNIVGIMLRGQDNWTKVAVFIETVLRLKKREADGGPSAAARRRM